MGALSFVSPNYQPYALLVLDLLHYKNLSGNPFNFTDLKHLRKFSNRLPVIILTLDSKHNGGF